MQDFVEAPRKRPLGVSIISVVVALGAIINLFLGGVALWVAVFGGLILTANGSVSSGAALGAVSAIVGIIGIIVGLVELLFAWGLWTLKPWAFWATVIIEAVNLLSGLIALIQHQYSGWAAVSTMIIPAIILIYFLADSNVRAAFRT
jgi:hypothetical protein